MTYELGFTGTQKGMTIRQHITLCKIMGCFTHLHHGDCIGSDFEAHVLAKAFRQQIWVHPPLLEKKRAFCDGWGVRILEPKPYLSRNHDIARCCDVLFATPRTGHPTNRSGTWFTVGYALSIGRPAFIILPDGKIINAKSLI